MRTRGRDLGDELGKLLVGQVPGALSSAVVEHQGLVEVIGLDRPEGLRRRLLRAVAAVAEEGDILRTGKAEVLAEGPDDRVAGRLMVDQGLQLQDVLDFPSTGVDPGLQVLLHRPDIVDAALQAGDRQSIMIDADQQSVDRLHGGVLTSSGRRPA